MSADQDKAYAALKVAVDIENVAMTTKLGTFNGSDQFSKLMASMALQLGIALTHAIIDVADAIRENYNKEDRR